MISNYIVKIDEYTVDALINRGSYGNVYKVHKNDKPELFFAAKESRDDIVSNEDQERFFKDMAPISISKNPAILKYHGFNLTNFSGDPKPTIFMDFMPNGSLRELLNKNPNFPLSKKYIILLGIAKGMNHLHTNGVIHRDLKPENILLDANYYPQICDFGESKIADMRVSEIRMSTYRGTCGYMAPEIFIQEKPIYTYKVDIFAFAMVSYEIITGIRLFTDRTSYKIMKDIENGLRPNLSLIHSKAIKDLLSHCWSSNPTDRPTFSQIINEISKDEFKQAMNANEQEVKKYIELFEPFENMELENPLNIEIRADEGDIDAMLKFAKMQLLGDKVPENKRKAAQYYKMAADSGNAYAMYIYGHMLYIGHGIPSSYFTSCTYYRRANSKNDAEAMLRFANTLYYGIGLPVHKPTALEYYKKAADKGNEEAMYIYGYLTYNGNDIREKKSEAANYFKIAADKGRTDAMHNYADMLFNGDGIKTNRKEALRYYKMAADNNHTDSCYIYATFLYFGISTEVDKPNSSIYFKKAADKGNKNAMFNYATMLYRGDGIPIDRKEAMKYYEMASNKDDPDSIEKVSTIRGAKDIMATK